MVWRWSAGAAGGANSDGGVEVRAKRPSLAKSLISLGILILATRLEKNELGRQLLTI